MRCHTPGSRRSHGQPDNRTGLLDVRLAGLAVEGTAPPCLDTWVPTNTLRVMDPKRESRIPGGSGSRFFSEGHATARLVNLAEAAGLDLENALGPQDRALVREQVERVHVELVVVRLGVEIAK